MVYDWDAKEDLCYDLYINQKKPLEEIIEYMREHHNFAPSKRAFQTQFRKWDFPSKQNPAHKNANLVKRIKELWDINTSQRDMLRILNEEGHQIKERELMRVRAKHRWLLRVPNANKTGKQRNPDEDVLDQLQAALYPDGTAQTEQDLHEDDEHSGEPGLSGLPAGSPSKARKRARSPPLSPQILAKRQERLEKLQVESAERWASRKRRRRTRGWAGMPADPPGPPRFPSETTIDESKTLLNLDARLYRDVRARFQRICEEDGIMKKTIAGPERWEAAKDRLIQESTHLQTVFWSNNDNQEQKKLALDVVCGDVTKRMRTLERRMTIAEAKNILAVNPEESRQLRNAFYQTLKADHFTSKLEAGEDHWKELKQQWIDGSPILQRILGPGDADPQHADKVKATEVLCRDVMKRLRDDQTKRDPNRKSKTIQSDVASVTPNGSAFEATSTQAFGTVPRDVALVQAAANAQAQIEQVMPTVHTHAPESLRPTQHAPPAPQQTLASSHAPVMSDHSNMQIDPSLLLAAATDPTLLGRTLPSQNYDHGYNDQSFGGPTAAGGYATSSAPGYAVYFRLHPASDVQAAQRLWVSTLTTVSVEEVRHVTATKYPGSIALRIEGVMKQPSGHEMMLPIDQDEEFEAYMAAIGGVKPTLTVQLVTAWKNN